MAADRAGRTTTGDNDDNDGGGDDDGNDGVDPGDPFGTNDGENPQDENEDHLVLKAGLSQAYEIRSAGTAPIHVRAYEDTRRLTVRELSRLLHSFRVYSGW